MDAYKEALYWADRDVPVFPLMPHSKVPATRNGFHDASVERSKLKGWFEGTEKNIGIRTGGCSGFAVVDIDVKSGKNGLNSLSKKFGAAFALPENVLIFRTPNDGFHIPVRIRSDQKVANKVNVLGIEGVDIRGEGGYIVAPPSTLVVDGIEKAYSANDLELPMASVEAWIADLFSEMESSSKDPGRSFEVSKAMKGADKGE